MYLFFSFSFRYIIFCTLVLWPFGDSKHCICLWYIYLMMLLSFSPISSCVVSFISLCTCFLFIVCNLLYFCFTLRCHNEFCLKCFRNIGCQSLSCHELFSCKVFQEFVLGLDFIVFNKWVWVEGFMTYLIWSFVCYGFVMDCLMGRLLGHMWIMLRTYVI